MSEKQNWNKMVGVRLDAKTLYLVEIARQAKGEEFATFTDYLKWALGLSFEQIKIEDDQQGYDSKPIPGRTLAQLADVFYQGTEAGRFLVLVKIAPWLTSEGESKLLRILQHSDYFASRVNGSPVLNEGRVHEHWPMLAAIRDGEADLDILPANQQPRKELAFGLMTEAEKVALYKSDNARYKRESAAYAKAMKGGK